MIRIRRKCSCVNCVITCSDQWWPGLQASLEWAGSRMHPCRSFVKVAFLLKLPLFPSISSTRCGECPPFFFTLCSPTDPAILNGVYMSEALNPIFVDNFERDPTLTWQYFGSSTGFFRLYPGKKTRDWLCSFSATQF